MVFLPRNDFPAPIGRLSRFFIGIQHDRREAALTCYNVLLLRCSCDSRTIVMFQWLRYLNALDDMRVTTNSSESGE